jgi:hypothetical protein
MLQVQNSIGQHVLLFLNIIIYFLLFFFMSAVAELLTSDHVSPVIYYLL